MIQEGCWVQFVVLVEHLGGDDQKRVLKREKACDVGDGQYTD